MMESRFESAKLYLIDLLRAYGHRMIIVKIKQDGEDALKSLIQIWIMMN